VPVRSSVKPEYIVCLEDGKKLKMLKRYLMSNYRMTPDDYRVKWNLPADYPMVAASYAEKRRTLAKAIGLGGKPKGAAVEPEPNPSSAPAKKKLSIVGAQRRGGTSVTAVAALRHERVRNLHNVAYLT
jgi:hypothetical protein